MVAAPFISKISWGQTSPMQRVQHVAVGLGSQGWRDCKEIVSHEAVTLVAAADVDSRQRANLERSGQDVPLYHDWREIFANEDFDSISVSTPDHLHGVIGLSALQLGKHVYGEKPLGGRILECRQLADAARETGLVTQMGNQLASSLQERMSVELLRAGAVGKIKRAHAFSHKNWGDDRPTSEQSDPIPEGLNWNLWCGPARKRPYRERYYHPGHWRRRQDYGTGCLGDMGCHIWNPLYRGLGLTAPISVRAETGVTNPDNWATKEHVRYVFPGNELTEAETIEIFWYSGKIQPPSEVLAKVPEKLRVPQGSIYEGTEGTLLVPHGSRPFLLPMEDFTGYQYPKLEPRDHYHEFIDCIIGRQKEAPISNFLYAGPATESVLLGCVASLFPGEELEWDAEGCRVSNLEAANAHLSIEYREGHKILDKGSASGKS